MNSGSINCPIIWRQLSFMSSNGDWMHFCSIHGFGKAISCYKWVSDWQEYDVHASLGIAELYLKSYSWARILEFWRTTVLRFWLLYRKPMSQPPVTPALSWHLHALSPVSGSPTVYQSPAWSQQRMGKVPIWKQRDNEVWFKSDKEIIGKAVSLYCCKMYWCSAHRLVTYPLEFNCL